jgi:hypothetical protein
MCTTADFTWHGQALGSEIFGGFGVGIVSACFIANSVKRHHNTHIIKGFLLVDFQPKNRWTSTTPQVADARTILITFTIRAYLKRNHSQIQNRRTPLYVVAEILDSENVDHAFTAGADEVIETRKIGYSMIAHAVGFHGTATAMSRVLISGSHNVYIGVIPGSRKEPVPFGQLLAELQLSKRGALVIGLRTSSGKEIINPPKSMPTEPDSHLLYLAETPVLDPPG